MTTSIMSQQSSSVMTQHFHKEIRRRENKDSEIISPDGDLRDVEADFQSLVNEMVQGSSKRALKSAQAFSDITSSTLVSGKVTSPIVKKKQALSSKLSITPELRIGAPASDSTVVMAVPARVVPENEIISNVGSEVVVEKQMRVKDRIKKLEKQLSQEAHEAPQPPEVILPRSKSGSIRNLAEQFEATDESSYIVSSCGKIEELQNAKSVKELASAFSDQPESNALTRRVEEDLEFKNVKEVASLFQDPITPVTIKPPAPFSDANAPEAVSPVPVLPPAMQKNFYKPPVIADEPSAMLLKFESQPSLLWKKEAVENKEEVIKTHFSESLSQSSTLNETTSNTFIQQPIQYSAQVRCEVRSGVSTPEVSEHQQIQQNDQSETVKSMNGSMFIQNKSLSFSSGGAFTNEVAKSTFRATAPAPLAKTSAKPPRSENIESGLPKFSLLRSASAGSVRDALQSDMTRTKSDKDIPKFTVKKLKCPASKFYKIEI